MRFSPASRLTDRQTVWVGYANDGAVIDKRHQGHPATVWSAQFEDAFRNDGRQAQWGCPPPLWVGAWQSQRSRPRPVVGAARYGGGYKNP